jgi:hypothetical protein
MAIDALDVATVIRLSVLPHGRGELIERAEMSSTGTGW